VLGMCGGGCPKDRVLDAGGAPGGGGSKLNFLCEGYKEFFLHARPFVQMLPTLRQPQAAPAAPGQK